MSSFLSEYKQTAITVFRRGHFLGMDTEELGNGAEAKVYSVDTHYYGKVAVKEFFRPLHENSVKEIETLIRLNCHQNIVRIIGLLESETGPDKPRSGYVMEFMANGSLHQVIHGPTIYNRQQIYSWILQASRGIAYLHNHGLLHRDIKPQNMLLGETLNMLKIADFGLAKSLDRSLTALVGTLVYMAPEVFVNTKYDSSADVYSLAVSAWEMFHRKKPYYQQSVEGYQFVSTIQSGLRLEFEMDIEEDMKEAILNCFHLVPSKRPKVEHFLEISKKHCQISIGASVPLPEPTELDVPSLQRIWTEEERVVLAKTIFGEARGECLEGQHAVGHVVLNRKKGNKSYWGGNTVIGVCLKKGQFACWDGREDVPIPNNERLAYDRIYNWVPALLEGKVMDPTGGCDYFNNPSLKSDPGWVKQALMDGKRTVDIGNHRFYQIGH